jgi:murein L,D-transpeptidase YafK
MRNSFVFTKILLFILLLSVVGFRSSRFHQTTHNPFNGQFNGTPVIIVDKSDYELRIYDEDGWFATYPVVFGNKNKGDKMMEGDRKTPEGSFTIIIKRPHEKWAKMMLLDYPTPADEAKFKERKKKGLIPSNAKIGSGIGIHGTWLNDDKAIDLEQNWTNGCISLKRADIEELYHLIPLQTNVTIQY